MFLSKRLTAGLLSSLTDYRLVLKEERMTQTQLKRANMFHKDAKFFTLRIRFVFCCFFYILLQIKYEFMRFEKSCILFLFIFFRKYFFWN